MLHLVQMLSALVSGLLLQSGAAPAVDVDAATNEATAFVAALTARDYEQAEKRVAPLVKTFVELGKAAEAADAVKDAPSRELAAACRKTRKQIAEGFLKAVKDARAPAKVQQTILTSFGVQPEEGEKLDVVATGLGHITEVPESLAAAVRSLGSFRKSKYIDLLEKQLGDTRADVLNAAAHSLGELFGEKEEVRKQLVGKLLFAYENAGVTATPSNFSGPKRAMTDHDAVMKIRREFQIALARLTGGVHFDSAAQWADWYRDAKSAKWRDGLDKVSIKFDGYESEPCPVNPGKH